MRRGIATGANDFFVLIREQCAAHRLSPETLRPVLTSPRQLQSAIIEADESGVPQIPEPLFLLDSFQRWLALTATNEQLALLT